MPLDEISRRTMAPPASQVTQTARRGRGRGQRRMTENAPPSRVAEAEEVWHSTAINDSGAFAENIPPDEEITPLKKIRGNKRALDTVAEEKDSGRGGSSTREIVRPESGRSSSPVVISPPSGHSFFSSVLQKCGYIIKQPNASNEMYFDVMKFRMEMSNWLINNDDEMKRIETETSKFINALKAYLSDRNNFSLALKPTKHQLELIQPCLLSCLLGVDKLQEEILKIALHFLAEASLSSDDEEVAFVSTILDRLKWQSLSVDVKKLCDKLITFLDTATVMCQTHIVKTLPDILPSRIHGYAADKLLETFGDDGIQLNVALMDCFSSMDIPGERWTSIRYTAIDQMANAPFQDIPAYISFLFLSESKDCLNEIISSMREKVQLRPEIYNSRNDAFQVEILEKFGFCVTVNPSMANLWIKLIKDDIQNGLLENIKKIDMLMLFLFSDTHKSAISALTLIFAEKKLATDLFSEMMMQNTMMVYQLFSQICKILESFLRGRASKCSETVSDIIVELFVGLGDIEAQTLVGNLTGILINCHPARETILAIFTRLAEAQADKLLGFAPYLMGVLDFVQEFPARQIQSLMNILAILSQTEGRNSGGTNNFNSEFSILLRKQLTQRDLKIRCFGIMGALATVRQMAKKSFPEFGRMNELLKLAWTFVERDEDACGIFLDELGISAESLPPQICMQFCNILKDKFQNLWTIDAADDDQLSQFSQRSNLILKSAFDANKECTEERIIITFESKPLEMKPIIIPAHLHVLTILERKLEQSLVALDAILGSPILFPSMDDYFIVDSISDLPFDRRYKLGQYVVLAINFFRECVSAFVKDADSELRIKIWLRLENIVTLQKYLVKHFENFPHLPMAYASDKTIGSPTKDGPGFSGGFRAPKQPATKAKAKPKEPTKKGKGRKKGTAKKAKRDSNESSEEDDNDDNTNTAAFGTSRREKETRVNLEEVIQPKQILPYLRRFSQPVFENLLAKPIRFDNDNINFSNILMNLTAVSQNTTEILRVERFSPEVLTLVLSDLKAQINDSRASLNVLRVKRLLKYVCRHVNDIHRFLQEDEEKESSEEQSKLEGCLRLLLGVMTVHFDTVKKLDKEEKNATIDRTIKVLVKLAQTRQDDDEMTSQAVAMGLVGSYFTGLASIIKNPLTALEHIKMLKSLHDLLGGHAEVKIAIDHSSQLYLRNNWKLSSSFVDGILKIWLSTTQTPIKTISDISERLLVVEEGSNSKIPVTTFYKACSETNFHTWYAAMISHLSQYIYKKLRRRGEFEENIFDWAEAVKIFERLVNVTSILHKQVILSSLLKNCRLFLDAFISGGAELLPEYFKTDSTSAGQFCKMLQGSCRKIQHICEYAKKLGDPQLLKSVPLIKRVIESFVWKVREVLTLCGAVDAFQMGILKHRDLDGKVINSQIYEGEVSEDSLDDVSDSDDDDVRRPDALDVVEVENDDNVHSDRTSELPYSKRGRCGEPEVEDENSMDMDVDVYDDDD